MNKKGVSQVIITILMIILVLGAISIIFVMANGLLKQGSDEISMTQSCLKINVVATRLVCEDESCNVTLNRKAGGDDIAGVKLIFKNSDSRVVGENVEDVPGNIPELGTKVAKDKPHGLEGELPDTVEVAVYVLSESGEEQICTQTREFKF